MDRRLKLRFAVTILIVAAAILALVPGAGEAIASAGADVADMLDAVLTAESTSYGNSWSAPPLVGTP